MSVPDTQVPRHPIQVASRRSGLTTHVIRAWEKRYGAVQPRRSGTSRRLYSDAEIGRLNLLRRATESGWRIGDVAALPDNKLSSLLREEGLTGPRLAAPLPELEAPSIKKLQEVALDAVMRLDASTLAQALERAAATQPTPALMEQMIKPLMLEIGERWRIGRLRACHEHFASAQIRTFLGDALAQAVSSAVDGPVMLVTTPLGQTHELGALMSAVIAARAGWRVLYLGPSLPADEIVFAADMCKAQAVSLSLVYPADDSRIPVQLLKIRAGVAPSVPIFVGGQGASGYQRAIKQIGALEPEDLLRFDRDLEALRRNRSDRG